MCAGVREDDNDTMFETLVGASVNTLYSVRWTQSPLQHEAIRIQCGWYSRDKITHSTRRTCTLWSCILENMKWIVTHISCCCMMWHEDVENFLLTKNFYKLKCSWVFLMKLFISTQISLDSLDFLHPDILKRIIIEFGLMSLWNTASDMTSFKC